MSGINGDYASLAEAVGEYTPAPGYVFFPGESFDPYDDDDVAAVMMVGESDRMARMARLEAENADLRRRLAALDENATGDDGNHAEDYDNNGYGDGEGW
ncbi:MAG: hypothetical protein ABWZ30_01080 [Jiangellaceae bacterium]